MLSKRRIAKCFLISCFEINANDLFGATQKKFDPNSSRENESPYLMAWQLSFQWAWLVSFWSKWVKFHFHPHPNTHTHSRSPVCKYAIHLFPSLFLWVFHCMAEKCDRISVPNSLGDIKSIETKTLRRIFNRLSKHFPRDSLFYADINIHYDQILILRYVLRNLKWLLNIGCFQNVFSKYKNDSLYLAYLQKCNSFSK